MPLPPLPTSPPLSWSLVSDRSRSAGLAVFQREASEPSGLCRSPLYYIVFYILADFLGSVEHAGVSSLPASQGQEGTIARVRRRELQISTASSPALRVWGLGCVLGGRRAGGASSPVVPFFASLVFFSLFLSFSPLSCWLLFACVSLPRLGNG